MELSNQEYQHLLQEIIRETGAKRDGSGKNLIVPRCPFCGKTGGKFGIYIGKETPRRKPLMAHCFSCGASTRTLEQLLAAICRMDLMVAPTTDIASRIENPLLPQVPEEIDDEFLKIALPDFYKRTFHNQYLQSRNFRKDEKSGYELMKQPVDLSFISVAGINRPELTSDGMIAEHLIEPTRRKMRTIFRIGLRHSHNTLVLGALGCGAFANPPRHIARLFHEVMKEEEFRNKYRLIVFAVLDDHNSHRSHNPEGNFVPFYNEFVQNVNDR